MLYWTIRIAVDESWVADGFNPDEGRFREAIATMLPHSLEDEIEVKIIKSPDPNQIRTIQNC